MRVAILSGLQISIYLYILKFIKVQNNLACRTLHAGEWEERRVPGRAGGVGRGISLTCVPATHAHFLGFLLLLNGFLGGQWVLLTRLRLLQGRWVEAFDALAESLLTLFRINVFLSW